MYYKEFRAIIEALETAHAESRDGINNPHDTARRFIRAVGAEAAAQCVVAMVRRLSWDGRISRTAKAWAESVPLSADWEHRIDEAYTDRIHTAHLSQIAEAMPAELEHTAAEEQSAAARYMEQVEQADTLDALDQITEAAAMDDTLTGAQYEAVYAAALHKAQIWDPQNRERREHPAQEPQYTAETYKDNAGRLHLAVLDSAGACVYYLTDADSALVMDALAALVSGGDPIADQWEGGEPDPAAAYKWITQTVEARNGGAWEIDAIQAMRGGAME